MQPPELQRLLGPVRRIGVLRALMLGDMLCATPFLRALAARWPQAGIVLVGLPWAQAWSARQPSIHRFIDFPGYPGLPERQPAPGEVGRFMQRMRSERFDLLIQLHGSGGIVNPLVQACGARHTAGFVPAGEGAASPFFTPWPGHGHEIERLLRLADHLGVARQGLHLDWTVRDGDRQALSALLPPHARLACVHPGARFASRRWPPARFAAVADVLAAAGFQVVLTGAASEGPLAAQVAGAMRRGALDLSGRTDLGMLGALLEAASVLVCNDTGVSHLAAAIGTPSVVVSCGSDARRWLPLDAALHRGLWQDVPCRPCAHEACPTAHECAAAIDAQAVAALAVEQARIAPASTRRRVRQPEAPAAGLA